MILAAVRKPVSAKPNSAFGIPGGDSDLYHTIQRRGDSGRGFPSSSPSFSITPFQKEKTV